MMRSVAEAVKDGSTDRAASLCEEALGTGKPPREIIHEGLSRGMHELGELYDSHQVFLPELLLAAEAMHAGIEVLLPSLKAGEEVAERETVVLGVVEGDVHEIGKNLVGVMLEAEGYRVIDLGYDVTPKRFLDEVRGTGARVLALSTMMTTTLPNMRRAVEMAQEMDPRPVIVVGGAPLSVALADDMGADGYEDNAAKVPGLLAALLA